MGYEDTNGMGAPLLSSVSVKALKAAQLAPLVL